MFQQDMFPPADSDSRQIENKILLLYLIEKMDIPLSNNQIAHFALEENYMNIYTLQQYLREMVEVGYLEKTQDNGQTHYLITDGGSQALEAFMKQIPNGIKNRIIQYVAEHRKIVNKDYEVTASHFYDHATNEYIVKCSAYEDQMMLMELNLPVVSREQALRICSNWKNNITNIYGQIINILVTEGNKLP